MGRHGKEKKIRQNHNARPTVALGTRMLDSRIHQVERLSLFLGNEK